jgi:hypothetical protein
MINSDARRACNYTAETKPRELEQCKVLTRGRVFTLDTARHGTKQERAELVKLKRFKRSPRIRTALTQSLRSPNFTSSGNHVKSQGVKLARCKSIGEACNAITEPSYALGNTGALKICTLEYTL